MKVHIIGGPGAGKTSLSLKLAAFLNCEILHLDDIAYQNRNFDKPTSREYRIAQVSSFTKRRSWIVEGVYFSWVGSSFKHCDKIVFIAMDKLHRKNNILKRLSINGNLNEEQLKKQKDRLLKSNSEFDDLFDKRISGFLKKFESKVLIIDTNETDFDDFLNSMLIGV